MARRAASNPQSDVTVGPDSREKSAQQKGQEHLRDRRQAYFDTIKPVPELVQGLSKRISELRKNWRAHGSLSQKAVEQERMVATLDELKRKLGDELSGDEKAAADKKRHDGYYLRGGLNFDNRVQTALENDPKYSGRRQKGPLSTFMEAIADVEKAEADLNSFLDRFGHAQMLVPAALRPGLIRLGKMAENMEQLDDSLKNTPIKPGSLETVDFDKFKAARRIQGALTDSDIESAHLSAKTRKDAEEKARTSLEEDFSGRMLDLVEQELELLQGRFNTGIESLKTDFFTVRAFRSERRNRSYVPYQSIQEMTDITLDNNEDISRLINSLEGKLDQVETLRRKINNNTQTSNAGQIIGGFKMACRELTNIFPEKKDLPTLKAGKLLQIDSTEDNAELVLKILDFLYEAENLLERQITYVKLRLNKLAVAGKVSRIDFDPSLRSTFRPMSVSADADSSEVHLAQQQQHLLDEKDQESDNIVDELSRLSENLEYIEDFKAAVSRGGVAEELFRQYKELEGIARQTVLEMGQTVARLMKKPSIEQALNSPLCQEFLPVGIRRMLLVQAQDSNNPVLSAPGAEAGYFTDMLAEARRMAADKSRQEELEKRSHEAKETRDMTERMLLDRAMEIERDELQEQILNLGDEINVELQNEQGVREKIYADVREISQRVMKYCEVIQRQLVDHDDASRKAVADILANLNNLATTAQSLGTPLALTDGQVVGNQTVFQIAMMQQATPGQVEIVSPSDLDNIETPEEGLDMVDQTVEEQGDRLRTALAPIVLGQDQSAKKRIERDIARYQDSMNKAIKNVHDGLHVDVANINRDLGEVLGDVISAVSSLCDDCEGYKAELDNARALVLRRKDLLEKSQESMSAAESARSGIEFIEAVQDHMGVKSPDNPLTDTLFKWNRAKSLLLTLEKKLADQKAGARESISGADINPEIAALQSQKDEVEQELIPALEQQIKIAEEKSRLWAEKFEGRSFDKKVADAKLQVEEANRQWKLAASERETSEVRFATAVSGVTILLDAQRALFTSSDAAEVLASENVSTPQQLSRFVAKLRAVGPRKIRFQEVHGREIYRVEDAEGAYAENVEPFLAGRGGDIRDHVGSDFVKARWENLDPMRMIGFRVGRSTTESVDVAPALTMSEPVVADSAAGEELDFSGLAPDPVSDAGDAGSDVSEVKDVDADINDLLGI